MLSGRLQPKGATLGVRVLFLSVCALGLTAVASPSLPRRRELTPPVFSGSASVRWITEFAAMSYAGAGQTPTGSAPATNKANSRTSSSSTKVMIKQPPPGVAAKSTGTAPDKVVGAESPKTIAPRIPSAAGGRAGPSPVSRPLPVNKMKTPTPLPPSKPIHNPPLGATRKTLGEVRSKQAGAELLTTTPPSIPPLAAGRRDPFKAWVAPSMVGHSALEAGPLPAGTRGLVISGLRLEGVVRQDPTTMMAVVTNYTKRAYFLRVNDAVYNGVDSKITPEAIYFKENTLDSRGRVATHEVEIKLGSAPGEGR